MGFFYFIVGHHQLILAANWAGDSQVIDLNSMKKCWSLPKYPLSGCEYPSIGCAGGGVVNGLILICGSNYSYKPFCYTYDPDENDWSQHACLEKRALYSGITVIKGALMLTGGYNLYLNYETQMVYAESERDRGIIEYGPRLRRGRYHHCTVNLLDGRFLVVGGYIQDDWVDRAILTTEFHAFNWSSYLGPSLPSERIDPACVVFHSPLHNNRYVVLIIGQKDWRTRGQQLLVLDYTQPLATWERCE